MDKIRDSTKGQRVMFYRVLPKKLQDYKEIRKLFVKEWTGDDRESITQLDAVEAADLIFVTKYRVFDYDYAHYAMPIELNKQYGYMLNLLEQMGWAIGDKVDWERLGKWVATRTKLKLPLSALSQKEMNEVVNGVKAMHKAYTRREEG